MVKRILRPLRGLKSRGKKIDQSKKEGTMKYLFLAILALGLMLPCFADDSQDIGITANVNTQTPTFDISVTPVAANGTATPNDDTWGTADTTPPYNINFGTLTLDTQNGILTTDTYYAVDVGIASNVPYTVSHSGTSISGPGGNLDGNVNVAFVATTGSSDTDLDKVSYASARTGVSYIDTDFSATQWLRIYYGVGTGSGDATGVTPIPATQTSGAYSGTVTLSVTTR